MPLSLAAILQYLYCARSVDLSVCMSVIRPISTVFRNVVYLWLIHMYSLCKELQCWEWKCYWNFFF
jgi:hypothetical protein